MELSPSDKRIKQLMEQCGHPNSMSLYQAFKQFEMEIRLECRQEVWPRPAKATELVREPSAGPYPAFRP